MDDSFCVVQVRDAVQAIDPHLVAMACGSYRRGKATCGDVDVLISHPDGKSHKGVFSKVLQSLHDSGKLYLLWGCSHVALKSLFFLRETFKKLFISQVFWQMTLLATRRMESRRNTWACAVCQDPASATAGLTS